MWKITASGLAKYIGNPVGIDIDIKKDVTYWGILCFDSKRGFYVLASTKGATNIRYPIVGISVSQGNTIFIGKEENYWTYQVDLTKFDSAAFCRKELKKLLKCSDKALDSLLQKISQFIQ